MCSLSFHMTRSDRSFYLKKKKKKRYSQHLLYKINFKHNKNAKLGQIVSVFDVISGQHCSDTAIRYSISEIWKRAARELVGSEVKLYKAHAVQASVCTRIQRGEKNPRTFLHVYAMERKTSQTEGFSKPCAPSPSTRPVRSVSSTGANQSPADEALLLPCLCGFVPCRNSLLLSSELRPLLLHQREASLASWSRPVRETWQSASPVSNPSGTGNRLAG